jgi:hypothetical protein
LWRSYLASLPERTARVGTALTGGLVYEASEVVLPVAVHRSKLYQAIVGRLLRITIELVGSVEDVYPTEEMRARELLVRKTAGNAIELSSFLAVGWSPVWLLAGASDLVGGTKVYLQALVTELRDAGVLAADVDVASFEELLTVLEGTSGVLVDTVDVRPLNVPSGCAPRGRNYSARRIYRTPPIWRRSLPSCSWRPGKRIVRYWRSLPW